MFFDLLFKQVLKEILYENPKAKLDTISYYGRKPSIAPATGSPKVHLKELNEFMNALFSY